MANIISVTSFTSIDGAGITGTTAKTLGINVSNIIGVYTKATPYLTTGITNIVYELQFNNERTQIALVVTEATAAVITAANAALVAAP